MIEFFFQPYTVLFFSLIEIFVFQSDKDFYFSVLYVYFAGLGDLQSFSFSAL